MSRIKFRLFGNFQACLSEELATASITGKPEELFCFLLLHRQMMTARESLATLLWGGTSTVQSKKYLRDALWKLQERLALSQEEPPVLLASAECVYVNPQADVWVDVAEFEAAFSAVAMVRGRQLTPAQAQSLRCATALYRGDLLEGWYQDWCLCERVRFQDMHQKMLHKLMNWCEANGQYEQGLQYGEALLHQDFAYERAHRAMMRLRYLAGDRTGALRQYERCVAALREGLDVTPSRRTIELHEQIRADQLESLLTSPTQPLTLVEHTTRHLPELLAQCKHLLLTLRSLEAEVQSEVESLERSLKIEEKIPQLKNF